MTPAQFLSFIVTPINLDGRAKKQCSLIKVMADGVRKRIFPFKRFLQITSRQHSR
jgi:hypothetical protein